MEPFYTPLINTKDENFQKEIYYKPQSLTTKK
jgi:hypothetical protein